MSNASYQAPGSIADAVALLAGGAEARPLAGGTDLLIRIRGGAPPPSMFVDLKRIPELSRFEVSQRGARIGAAVSAAEIAEHAELRRGWPGVAEAVALIGSTQIQGRATLGGNLCNASPAADTTPALIVNRAVCRIAGPGGERRMDVAAFVTGPGETALAEGEILVDIELPPASPGSGDAYLRLIPRTEMDIAIAGAAAWLELDEAGRCVAARVAIGAVAPTARLVPQAGEALEGTAITATEIEQAAEAARDASEPIDDKRAPAAYRKSVVGVLTKRAIESALARAKEGRQ